MKRQFLTSCLALVALTVVPALSFAADVGIAKQAKLSMVQASAIALKARPGEITEIELKKAKESKPLHYSFDITSNDEEYEVEVNAITGDVLENEEK